MMRPATLTSIGVASSSSRVFRAVELVELAGEVLARKIVGEGLARGAPGGELFAAFGDQAVFVPRLAGTECRQRAELRLCRLDRQDARHRLATPGDDDLVVGGEELLRVGKPLARFADGDGFHGKSLLCHNGQYCDTFPAGQAFGCGSR
jgi:hypothetical protein